MTEDEAKTKWCPHARVPTRAAECSRNRGVMDSGKLFLPEGTKCLGSDCMAWRWTGNPHGYCGLAGKA